MLVLRCIVAVHVLAVRAATRLRDERAQTSVEYSLVLLGAGAVALLLLAWATKTGKVGSLMNAVFTRLTDHVKQ
ncbi:MAG TPA: hypothetical protein VGA13_04120 [Acidimicrobiales bacterium]